ncbi:prophage endopeptidase tail family protein [Paenibacillus sinopodophylli]|uniref:prophage endopeptidase tail family protein n=1 Tax=Paenibacillus sinopodophylli TaxID=1837342 RepID=UPI00110CED87|nr:prophage endopeptidase tail family protein [Paenibacillus sinopodophylli]
MKRLALYDKNLNHLGAVADATEIERRRRINSDYELTFQLPMSSEDYNIIPIKGHIKDDRGQYYVINDRARKREGVKRMVEYVCTHVMFKLADFKFPYASYIDEAYGVNITTLLTTISAATGGKFSFTVDDTFELKDIKDFGRGDCLQALNKVIDAYGCEIEPDNFVIHIKKQIGMNRGYEARMRKNIININFKDSASTLVTRLFSEMKDGRTFIGMAASNLTSEEYALLNAVPGAIVGGVVMVNYLISPYVSYWSNTTNTYFDGEYINQEIEEPIELLQAVRKSLREREVPAIDVPVSLADLHRIDITEPEAFLGDTIKITDSEMQVNGITARVTELREPLFNPAKQPEMVLANYLLRDYDDILADLNESKQVVDNITSGGKVRTGAFEAFAAQAVYDINNSKSEVIYDERGIVLRSKLITNDQVVLSSKGMYVSRNGGLTADAAITAEGILAPMVIGKLGNFVEIEIGIGNNVFKANQSGIHLGHQDFGSAPFRVNMAGQLNARLATIEGTIHATGGSFAGNISAIGTITGGTLTGAKIQTKAAGVYPRSEMSSTGDLFGVYQTANNYAIFTAVRGFGSNPAPALEMNQGSANLVIGHGVASLAGMGILANSDFEIQASGGIFLSGITYVQSWSNFRMLSFPSQSLQQALDAKAISGTSTSLSGGHNHGIPDGTRLAVVNSSGVITGSFIWSVAANHSHIQN